MKAIPVYNIIILPEVTYYFQEDYFKELAGDSLKKDEDIVFMVMKEEKDLPDLTEDDFYPIGVYATIDGFDKDGTVSVKAKTRVNVLNITLSEKDNNNSKKKSTAKGRDGNNVSIVFSCDFSERKDIEDFDETQKKEVLNEIKASFMHYIGQTQWGFAAMNFVVQWSSMEEMVSSISSRTDLEPYERYAMLEADSVKERYELMEKAMYEFLAFARIGTEAESYSAESNEKLYREDAIRKQIEFLQRELDEMNPDNVTDARRFEIAIEDSGMNDTARSEAKKVLNRMKQEGHNSSEYGMLYDYLDFVTGLKWVTDEVDDVDIARAKEILDEDHYGLDKVKRRILQQMAVMALKKSESGSIILFVGAPGTGKTSIGQSIAKALGRKYVRVSLGGVRDEAEIRGHRRTYIGAMPGRIMDGIRKSGAMNPVMVLDEVDKLSKDYSGDPSSALLEVLDPEQNFSFTDHYMNVPYDLSKVLFVCTANTTDTIPEPLLNRMEVIDFQGYTATEKFQIAKRHLIPKAMDSMGIKKSKLKISDETVKAIIADYTAESGVRGLKKRLDTICRVAAVKLVSKEQKTISVSPKKLREYLDMQPYRHDEILAKKQPGVVTGLAWTAAGGDILFIEAVFTPGEGKILITGKLGDVMKESVRIAYSLAKLRFPDKEEFFSKNDLHVHVPEGAVPKDGPSAGITITTAIISLISKKPVSPEYAMTGEVSLRGVVLPIGGLPEKLMAAQRAGIKKVLIPKDNIRDLDDVAQEIKSTLKILPVSNVEEVLKIVKVG